MQERNDRDSTGRKRLCIALIAFGILSVIGLVVATELTDVYVRSRTDPDYQSYCAVSEGMNCETVALSRYSTALGVPVSVWASAGYVFMFLLSCLGMVRLKDGFGRGAMLAFSTLFVAVSILLVWVMAAEIRSFCILCLALDVVNAGLLAMAVLAAHSTGQSALSALRYDIGSLRRRPLLPAIVAVVGAGTLAGGWSYGRQVAASDLSDPGRTATSEQRPEQKLDSPEKWTSKVHGECGPECPCAAEEKVTTLQMGTDAAGHAWIGNAGAALVIEEYTDYECPYCRKAHMMVRKLLSNHPERVKVVHRHFPLDSACNRMVQGKFHERACELSRVAICAGKQGRFWEMNDYLFQRAAEILSQNLTSDQIARSLELDAEAFRCCMDDAATAGQIRGDIEDGLALRLKGTPAFVISGTVYYGKIPDEAVKTLE